MARKIPRKPTTAPTGASSDYLSAPDAAKLLGVKVPSLYSYVSRGLIRSVMQPGTRARLYYREDVESAGKRMGGRAGIPETVETAVRWGQPMLATSITELDDAGPRYRGRPALELAASGRSFESVAELLWSGLDLPALRHWEHTEPAPEVWKRIESATHGIAGPDSGLTSGRVMVLANVMLALANPGRPDFERGSTVTDARQLIALYASTMGLLGPGAKSVRTWSDRPIGELLAAGLLGRGASAEALRAIDAALIVCADHELSPSTLAARVAASSGADLRACLHAAIVTQSGTRLGGGCDRAEVLLAGARTPGDLKVSIAGLEKSGQQVPGFNLVAYPKGDPRALHLLGIAAAIASSGSPFKRLGLLLQEARDSFDLKPSIEVGLIGLALALGLPRRSASAIWTVGRCAGWTAHVIEQRLAGFMLRPRAKYISPHLQSASTSG